MLNMPIVTAVMESINNPSGKLPASSDLWIYYLQPLSLCKIHTSHTDLKPLLLQHYVNGVKV